MLEHIIAYLSSSSIPVWGILIAALLVSLLENVFPPSPSDTILILLGSFTGFGKVGFVELLIFATIGSTIGFLIMFYLGKLFGHRIVHSNRWKFINEQTLEKPRAWFSKYGYIIIVANRFLSGTRAVISFFAGISELNTTIIIILSTVSALIWNGILIFLGKTAGQNWHLVDKLIEYYGNIIFLVFVALGLILLGRFLFKKRKSAKS